MRTIPLTLWLLLNCVLSGTAFAAGVKIEINGLPEEQREAVRTSLTLADYDKRDISAVELRAAYKKAEDEIRRALEPFGFYDPSVTPHLTGNEADGWTARFDVVHGDPSVVREARVEVEQQALELRLEVFVVEVAQRNSPILDR